MMIQNIQRMVIFPPIREMDEDLEYESSADSLGSVLTE